MVQLVSTLAPNCTPPSPSTHYTVAECKLVRSDTAADPNAHHLWGARYACASNQRVSNPRSGGDPRPTALGTPQGNTAYRKLTVFDGDNYSGERCELGYNTWNEGLANPSNPYGTFYNYFEGTAAPPTSASGSPTTSRSTRSSWQGVGQMKQSRGSRRQRPAPRSSPSAPTTASGPSGTPTPSDLLQTSNSGESPAHKNVWTRIEVDAYYSQYRRARAGSSTRQSTACGAFACSARNTLHTQPLVGVFGQCRRVADGCFDPFAPSARPVPQLRPSPALRRPAARSTSTTSRCSSPKAATTHRSIHPLCLRTCLPMPLSNRERAQDRAREELSALLILFTALASSRV